MYVSKCSEFYLSPCNESSLPISPHAPINLKIAIKSYPKSILTINNEVSIMVEINGGRDWGIWPRVDAINLQITPFNQVQLGKLW